LSLIPALLGQVLVVEGISMGVNYGANKVRFPAPVPIGAELRLGATLASVEEVQGGVQVTLDTAFELKDAPKPSCVAQVVYRFYR
jgi:acyl dehydratase